MARSAMYSREILRDVGGAWHIRDDSAELLDALSMLVS